MIVVAYREGNPIKNLNYLYLFILSTFLSNLFLKNTIMIFIICYN